MRAFCYDSIEEKERQPWETITWLNKWPELCDFLNDSNSIYGSTIEDYALIMSQFQEVQSNFQWMIKAYYYYIKENSEKFRIEPPPSPARFFLPKIIGVLFVLGVILYFVLK